jgi:hypothetical protein
VIFAQKRKAAKAGKGQFVEDAASGVVIAERGAVVLRILNGFQLVVGVVRIREHAGIENLHLGFTAQGVVAIGDHLADRCDHGLLTLQRVVGQRIFAGVVRHVRAVSRICRQSGA